MRDPRANDLNLSDAEWGMIVRLCDKFDNMRDLLEDKIQDVCEVLALVLPKTEIRVSRYAFIYRVAVNTLTTRSPGVLTETIRDAIYHSFDSLDDLDQDGSLAEKYSEERGSDSVEWDLEKRRRLDRLVGSAELGTRSETKEGVYGLVDLCLTVEEAMSHLSKEQAYIVRSILWEGRSQEDLASELGVSQGTISNRYRESLQFLKPYLDAEI